MTKVVVPSLLRLQSPTEDDGERRSVAGSKAPLWLQAQDAQAIGRRHGLALLPLDLRDGYALRRWPGSPELRVIYIRSAERVILDAAKYRGYTDAMDAASHLGIPTNEAELEWEIRCSQALCLRAIDEGLDPATTRFH
jgi:hypothetical protein